MSSLTHSPITKLLFYSVRFLKKTSYHHKKKLITLVVIALLSYIAKKKLRFVHLLQLAQKITKVIQYLPLPTFPQYRKLNRYEQVHINPLMKQIIHVMNVDDIKQKIKQKQSDWNQLKLSILSGTILSLVLYNIQSFYFIVQNKYQPDFVQLNSIETFQQMMGQIRKKFVQQIPTIKQALVNMLSTQIQSININVQYSLDDYFLFIQRMVEKVFERKSFNVKKQSQKLKNNPYRNDKHFLKAQNYFVSPYQYIPKKVSKISKLTSKIAKIASIFNFKLFSTPVCEISQQRFSWIQTAYRIPLKKSVSDTLQWLNRESELLSKLVLTEMDQMLSSVNFSTILYQHAQYNMKVLKNRLFLFFSKNNVTHLRTAKILPIFYKLIKQEILISNMRNSQQKREKFYESEILKAIRHKKVSESKILQKEASQQTLLIREQKCQVQQQQRQLKEQKKVQLQKKNSNDQAQNPEVILLNMHLEQIYQSRQFSHLAKEFEIKYFNQRSGVVLNPVQKQGQQVNRPGSEEDDIKKLLSMLGDNQELNKKD